MSGWWSLALTAYVLAEGYTRGKILHTAWREFIRLFVLLELGSMRLVRMVIKPRYELKGECHKRGVCCKQIVGDPPKFLQKGVGLWAFLTYHRVAHNFHAVSRGPDGEVVFSCHHLQPGGGCGIYRYRPLLCRNYPVRWYFKKPGTLPGCGYYAVPRVVSKMKPRSSLPIVDAHVAVHHPSPADREAEPAHSDYHFVSAPTEDTNQREHAGKSRSASV